MKKINRVIVVLALGLLVTGLCSCQKKEGPAERAGKEIDKAAEKAGEKIEKVGDKIKDTVKEIKK